jgi:hypothetical protein
MARFFPPLEMLPNDMAPVAKRLTIWVAGSTSSSGTEITQRVPQAAQVHRVRFLLVDGCATP